MSLIPFLYLFYSISFSLEQRPIWREESLLLCFDSVGTVKPFSNDFMVLLFSKGEGCLNLQPGEKKKKKKDVRSGHGFSDVLSGLQATSGWKLWPSKGWSMCHRPSLCQKSMRTQPWGAGKAAGAHRAIEVKHPMCVYGHSAAQHHLCPCLMCPPAVQGSGSSAMPQHRGQPLCPCRTWGLCTSKSMNFPKCWTHISTPQGSLELYHTQSLTLTVLNLPPDRLLGASQAPVLSG